MFYRRKKQDDAAGKPQPAAQRRVERHVPRDYSQFHVFLEPLEEGAMRGQTEDTLVVQVDSQLDRPVQGRLVDLSIQGVSIVIGLQSFPALTEGEIVGVRIEHALDEWCIRTPGLVRAIEFENGRWVRVGLEFVNPGNLFAQLEDARGQYFNRRRANRAVFDGAIDGQLRQKGTKVRVKLSDISSCGVGGWMDHVQGAMLQKEATLQLRLDLPDAPEAVEGPARLVYRLRKGERDRIGVSYDLEAWPAPAAKAVRDVVERYLAERFRWTG